MVHEYWRDNDGLAEGVAGELRTVLTQAVREGERLNQLRMRLARDREKTARQESSNLHAREQGERSVAASQTTATTVERDTALPPAPERAEIDMPADVDPRLQREALAAREQYQYLRDPNWETYTPEQIAYPYQVARSWSGTDPEAQNFVHYMHEQIRDRYGIDLENDPIFTTDELSHSLSVAEEERAAAQKERAEAETLLDQSDRAEDHALDMQDDPAEREELTVDADATLDRSELRYDSAERREVTAAELETLGLPRDAIDAKMTADVSQGTPPSAAVTDPQGRAPKARKRPSGPLPTLQRDGRGR